MFPTSKENPKVLDIIREHFLDIMEDYEDKIRQKEKQIDQLTRKYSFQTPQPNHSTIEESVKFNEPLPSRFQPAERDTKIDIQDLAERIVKNSRARATAVPNAGRLSNFNKLENQHTFGVLDTEEASFESESEQ